MAPLQYGKRYDVFEVINMIVSWANEQTPSRNHEAKEWISGVCSESDTKKVFLLMDVIMFVDNLLITESPAGGFVYMKEGHSDFVARYNGIDDSYGIHVRSSKELMGREVALPEDYRDLFMWISWELELLGIAIHEVRRRLQAKKMVNIFDGWHFSGNPLLDNQIYWERKFFCMDNQISYKDVDIQEFIKDVDKNAKFDAGLIRDYFFASVLRRKGTLSLDMISECLLLSQVSQ